MRQNQIKRILAAVRTSGSTAPPAVARAAGLARTLGAELELVSVVFDSAVAYRLARGDASAAAAQRGLIAAEERALERLAESARSLGVEVGVRVLWEHVVHDAILAEVERTRSDLLVVGEHEPEWHPHMRLTETDWQLMRLCPVPLLIAKRPDAGDYAHVLAAVDPLHAHEEPAGLDHRVLAFAALLRDALGAELTAANAYPDPRAFELASSVQVLPGIYYGPENIEHLHGEAAEELVTAYGIPPSQLELRPGDPVSVITGIVAERAVQLVVVGAVKRSRLEQATIGSTAERLVDALDCDVVLVKPRGG